ncbi:imidazole glycerol phosphate synthase subunit HisH [Taibaiella chishuiensis]|uniref:Imidazole glycerol phosphate synthase subunit HisH n=1 Tax=Taibaiella chishuiensis TaxID=1434707 RepID=A0A2P8DBW9_9BACT|nr:imidazole glycerol phosphate synthase subunit HisH [Taibaiella chishuiensis]PSK94675.1 glutamine amidotransferase [Taibaiella chishuiensis]
MDTVIIQYNAGNTRSVYNALQRLGVEARISSDEADIRAAGRVIFPGVGAAGPAMAFLRAAGLDKLLPSLEQPVLGICLGMQLMCRYSEEGDTNCLGIFDQDVLHFGTGAKVPHTGWNTLQHLSSPLFKGVDENSYVYYVHSYYVPQGKTTTASTDYMLPYSAALQKDNFYALQFHPEKSGPAGARILQNFMSL